jgi:hypothetical protein
MTKQQQNSINILIGQSLTKAPSHRLMAMPKMKVLLSLKSK